MILGVTVQKLILVFLALAPRHTKESAYKHWFFLSSSMRLLFGIPIMKLRQKRWRKCRKQQPGGSAGDCGTGVVSMICWMNLSGHPGGLQGEVLLNFLLHAMVQCLLIKIETDPRTQLKKYQGIS